MIDDLLRDPSATPDTDVSATASCRGARGACSVSANIWMGFRDGRGEEGRFPGAAQHVRAQTDNGEMRRRRSGRITSVSTARSDEWRRRSTRSKRNRPNWKIFCGASGAAFQLEFIIAGDDRRYVYWLERRGRGTFLRASPIDVSTLLQDKLFERVETIVLTSATLRQCRKFFVRARAARITGGDKRLIAPSGYDYERQAVLYRRHACPTRATPVGGRSRLRTSSFNISGGRAFVLSTSLSGMRSLYERVRAGN